MCLLAVLRSADPSDAQGWITDIEATRYAQGSSVLYPVIADPDREIATQFGMLDPDERNAAGLPMACRGKMALDNACNRVLEQPGSLCI